MTPEVKGESPHPLTLAEIKESARMQRTPHTRAVRARDEDTDDTVVVLVILAAVALLGCCCGGSIVSALWAVIG